MKKIKSIIKLLRVKQLITKNGFVFAGLIFASKFADINAIHLTLLAYLAFCAAAACIYVINDIMDRKHDANHPTKKNRPIASGAVKVSEAIVLAVILLTIAVCIPISINSIGLLLCVVSYLVLMILYSIKLKNVVIIDVFVIAFGFLLRAAAGVAVLEVSLSPWLILCSFLLALFLGLNKRSGELAKLGGSGTTRKVLKEYNEATINQMLSVVTPSLVVSYALYTFNSPIGPIMLITLPIVIYGIFRYIYISNKSTMHEAPDEVLLKDMPLLMSVVLWGITSVVLFVIY